MCVSNNQVNCVQFRTLMNKYFMSVMHNPFKMLLSLCNSKSCAIEKITLQSPLQPQGNRSKLNCLGIGINKGQCWILHTCVCISFFFLIREEVCLLEQVVLIQSHACQCLTFNEADYVTNIWELVDAFSFIFFLVL